MLLKMVTSGLVVSGRELISATLRSDLVPIPVTLEFNVLRSSQWDKELIVGADLTVGDPFLTMTIVKTQPLNTQTIRDSERLGGIACVAVLKGFEKLLDKIDHAVIIENTTFGSALRACGVKVVVRNDIPLPYFVCLKGQFASEEIAKRLQEEAAAIVCSPAGEISFVKLDQLMAKAPVAMYDESAIAWVNSPKVVAMSVPSYYSIDNDGTTVNNTTPTKNRPLIYKAKLSTRQLKNMEKVLIHRGTMIRPLDSKLFSGNIIQIGSKNYVILTGAMRVDTGSLGGSTATVSKVWLSSLYVMYDCYKFRPSK